MRRITAGLAIGLAAGVLALVIAHRPLFVTGESKLYDWRMRVAAKSGQPRGDIALVEINETSLRDLEPFVGRWQWPRITHAAIIGFIAAGRPKAIAYDVLFLEADTRLSFQYGEHVISGDESDGALGRAIQRAGNVVLLADASYEGVTGTAAQAPRPLVDAGYPFDAAAEAREIVTPPLDAYAAAAARAIGHNRLVLDSDGVARRIAPLVRAGDVMLPALGVAAAVEGAGLDKSSIRADRPLQIRFEGPPLDADGRRPYPSYEARHILLAADLGPGDCFGEMSLVTGEPRAASVAARGDCLAIEIPADAFAELARVNPVAVERVAALAAERRGPLEAARLAAHAGAPATVTGGLLSRMKRWMLKTKD